MTKRNKVQRLRKKPQRQAEEEDFGVSYEHRCDQQVEDLTEKYPHSSGQIKTVFNYLRQLNPDQLPDKLADLPEDIGRELDKALDAAEKEYKIGTISKRLADEFAKNMGADLKIVRDQGYNSQRAIAQRFNELKIKSMNGGEWSQNTVKNLIHRRRTLGLE